MTQGVKVADGVGIESLAAAGYVHFAATGDAAVGEFHCAECGYGVSVQRELPLCPMCGGTAWEMSPWPFARDAGRPPLQ